MNIGEAARATGVSARMIRHYETRGLIHPDARSDTGYRRYGERALQRLGFIRRARELGFSLPAIAGLLALWDDPDRASAEVKKLAAGHLDDLDHRIRDLTAMRDALALLVSACGGDHRPGCPILGGLEEGELKRTRTRTRKTA